MFKQNISFTSFVSGPSSGQCKLGEARKILLACKAWRGLGNDYLLVKSLEKFGQRILINYKISIKSWEPEVGKRFGRTSIKISYVIFSISYLVV